MTGNIWPGDKVRFKKGTYRSLKNNALPERRLGLEGLIGEVEHREFSRRWWGGNLPDLYRVQVHHPESGITIISDFTRNEIEGPLVSWAGRG